MAIGWVELAEARVLWSDAEAMDDVELTTYLLAAYEQCSTYAPVLDELEPVPESWKLAQIMQARAQVRSLTAGRDDNMTADGLTVTVFPLDWNVKQLLRPKQGKLSVR